MSDSRLQLVEGDITKLDVDGVVNAAKGSLLGGGGVDGAIHAAAGPELLAECRTLGGCPTGEARVTRGYQLRAKFVIHTVGPVWRGGADDEARLLASCYTASLHLAERHQLERVAFPCISTGAYGYPHEPAAEIAVHTIRAWLADHEWPRNVLLCAFNEPSRSALRAALDRSRRG